MSYSVQKMVSQLKAARLKKGLSQRAFSAKTGIPQSHISRIENGEVDLQLSSFIQIARALELEVSLIPVAFLPVVNSLQDDSPEETPLYSLKEGDEDG